MMAIRSDETRRLIDALCARTDVREAAMAAFKAAYPQAPEAMIQNAVFHVFVDGIEAALKWVAQAERFLRDPRTSLEGDTNHLMYHLYNWHQFEALLPEGREGLMSRLDDIELFAKENDPESIRRVVRDLRIMLDAGEKPPSLY